jgi:hypothetical protein
VKKNVLHSQLQIISATIQLGAVLKLSFAHCIQTDTLKFIRLLEVSKHVRNESCEPENHSPGDLPSGHSRSVNAVACTLYRHDLICILIGHWSSCLRILHLGMSVVYFEVYAIAVSRLKQGQIWCFVLSVTGYWLINWHGCQLAEVRRIATLPNILIAVWTSVSKTWINMRQIEMGYEDGA